LCASPLTLFLSPQWERRLKKSRISFHDFIQIVRFTPHLGPLHSRGEEIKEELDFIPRYHLDRIFYPSSQSSPLRGEEVSD
jgi:hypothetical protein